MSNQTKKNYTPSDLMIESKAAKAPIEKLDHTKLWSHLSSILGFVHESLDFDALVIGAAKI